MEGSPTPTPEAASGNSPWDCRWPDPIALQVAAQRILEGLPPERPGLNRRLAITVRLEVAPGDPGRPRALLVTPWAVERVHWAPPGSTDPPLRSAYTPARDANGRIAAGQGMLLEGEGGMIPVVVAWHPETGHYFVERLIPSVLPFDTREEALAAVAHTGAAAARPAHRTLEGTLERPTSRRGLLGLLRRSRG